MFKDAATFRRAANFAVETKIRAEAPGHLTLIIPIRDKRLFAQRGFTFRELYIRHVPWAARDSEATRSRTHPRW